MLYTAKTDLTPVWSATMHYKVSMAYNLGLNLDQTTVTFWFQEKTAFLHLKKKNLSFFRQRKFQLEQIQFKIIICLNQSNWISFSWLLQLRLMGGFDGWTYKLPHQSFSTEEALWIKEEMSSRSKKGISSCFHSTLWGLSWPCWLRVYTSVPYAKKQTNKLSNKVICSFTNLCLCSAPSAHSLSMT